MLLGKGTFGKERILARPTVELMTKDHLTPEQKALAPFFPHFWDARGSPCRHQRAGDYKRSRAARSAST